MKAIGYFREAPAGAPSLPQQNQAFLEYCAREGLDAVETFSDSASSNGTAPGFRQLVSFLRAVDVTSTVVVIPAVDVLGSDLKDAARRYFQIEGLGARVAAIAGYGDEATDLLNAWTSSDVAPNLSDRVRAAMRKKAVRGEVLGRPPFGYKVGSRRRLELVPEEAVVVRYIFRLYINENIGIRLIARRLNEEGLKTRRAGHWSMVSIRDILRNRAYLGTYARFGVRVPGSHTSLISEDDFRTVQDRLNSRRTSYSPRIASQFLLSRIAVCGHCGNKLIGVTRKQTWKRRSGENITNSYRYYQCESRTNQSICAYHTRRAAELEAELRAALARADHETGLQTEAHKAAAWTERQDEIARLRVRLRAVDRRFDRFVESAAKGRLSKEKLRSLGIAAATRRLAVEDALEAAGWDIEGHTRVTDEPGSAAALRLRVVRDWETMPFPEQRAALRAMLSRITVRDDGMALSFRT